MLPLRYGVVKRFDLGEGQKAAGYYVLGRDSTAQEGEELALPVIGMGFDACPALFRACGLEETPY